jgi:hypothetical protein
MEQMTNLITATVVGTMATLGVIGSDAITGDTHITAGVAVAVGFTSCGIVFTIGRVFQGIRDELKEINSKIKHFPCNHHSTLLERFSRQLARIEGKLNLTPYEEIKQKEETTTP